MSSYISGDGFLMDIMLKNKKQNKMYPNYYIMFGKYHPKTTKELVESKAKMSSVTCLKIKNCLFVLIILLGC